MSKNFFKKYFSTQTKLINFDNKTYDKLANVKKCLLEVKKKRKKVMIFGNGGSAAIASHFSVDLTKNSNIRCVNFNESSLLTCFSNDYGYENWIKKALEIYSSKGDILILVSCSGNSTNLVNANEYALKKGLKTIVLTGCKKNNKLNILKNNVKIWINSFSYNTIEITHHLILLSVIDKFVNEKKN